MKRKNIILILLSLLLLLNVCGCASSDRNAAPTIEAKTQVLQDEKFGAALMELNQESFEQLGFTLGDSCNVTFENGYTLTDVPYFNGYYVKDSAPVIVAYPGDSNVRITLNMAGIWDTANLESGDGVTVTLFEKEKYLATQEALGQIYSFDRTDYESDEAFCNFRALSGGTLKENFLFRGASPVDNSRCRAAYTDALLARNGIRFVVDLADAEADIAAYQSAGDFCSDYSARLLEDGAVVLLDMGSGYQAEAYRTQVAVGLRQMTEHEGPVYIHCMEGKDRTGFVCALLEALTGATYEEMLRDYMLTYQNYFKINEAETPEKYAAVVDLYFNTFMSFLHGTEDIEVLKTADYSEDAAEYLRSGGMTDGDIARLLAMITQQ